jgi:hypothetical protein
MDTKNWKWFRYNELFEIKKGKRLTKADMTTGVIPYIGATDSNNGITAKISNNEHLHSANTITVSYNGSIAEAYYQTKEFWATDDVNVLYPKFAMNVYSALFFTTIINKEKYRFNYGRKWDKELMKISKIKIPIDKECNPDWQWIENYIKETLVSKLPSKAKSVWKNNFDTKPISNRKLDLNTKEWKWFAYNILFKISGSKTTPKDELQTIGKGNYPYVTTQAVNNGVEGFYDFCTENGNVLTVDSAVLGYCSYQEKAFSASDHVEVLTPLFSMNKYIALFLTTLINKEQYRYNYGRKCSQIKLKASSIKLPAIKNIKGEYEPDWQWMEDYIKGLPYSACL